MSESDGVTEATTASTPADVTAPAAPAKSSPVATGTTLGATVFALVALLRIVLAVADVSANGGGGLGLAERSSNVAVRAESGLLLLLALVSLGAYAGWRKVAPMLGGAGPTARTDRTARLAALAAAGVAGLYAVITLVGLFGLESLYGHGEPHASAYGLLIGDLVVSAVIALGAWFLAKSLRPPRG
jgi:hypothetical protein